MMLIVLHLSVFGLTYLLRYFEGPFDVLLHFRKACGIQYLPVLDEDGNLVNIIEEPITRQHGWLARLVGCHWCLTTWVSIVAVVLYVWAAATDIMFVPFLIFSCTAVSGLLHDWNTSQS